MEVYSISGTVFSPGEVKDAFGKSLVTFDVGLTTRVKNGDKWESKYSYVEVAKTFNEASSASKFAESIQKGLYVTASGKPKFSAYISKKSSEAVSKVTLWADVVEVQGINTYLTKEDNHEQSGKAVQAVGSGVGRKGADEDFASDDLPF